MATSFAALVKRFARDERGASLVEYAVLVGIITAAIITTIGLLGDNINTALTNVSSRLAVSNANNN
jgi:pilus assembly protein Flp/PilA